MNKERMLALLQAMREANPENFDMKKFFDSDCGTPACLMGHYAARSDLQQTFQPMAPAWRSAKVIVVGLVNPTPEELAIADGEASFADFARHFDISESEADELFGSDGCGGAETLVQAIDYLEDFIIRKEMEE